ncbi:CaiB/BaiF CoA transferase family protein [Aeromicrobium yanjiei]|uniref:CoA transferase n=1 Tax=Aeromicrobium yanjiei TaxID=2662028 RepID=A0A5Q2MJW5_9ACTN|nr:CaiB/BaiF CoA-transferase family protein [Aeromicrobium yanjiei]QGG40595.1 CoA transferase [Aeromicrobium yanjiei]
MLPLEGVIVVSMEQAVAAPFASRQLADLGARVIKIERPGVGDFARNYDETVHGESSYFVWLNRSKESLTLDVKTPEGLAILHELLAGTDVFLNNLGPGAVARMGLDAETLATRYPRLIHATISGYGTTGDWAHRKAYDLLVQSEAGLVSITGEPGSVARVGISVADIAAGMYAYSGILTALLHRATAGVAAPVEVSLFEALAEWMGNPAYYTMYGGTAPERVGAQHASIAPYGPFTSAEGDIVMLSVQNPREWQAFCEIVMADPALTTHERFATNSARCAHRTELNETIGRRFAELGTTETISLLDEAKIANARVNTMAEFVDHPALSSRDRWVTVQSPGGDIRALKPPASIGGIEPRMDAVPALGAHTAAILTALGRSAADIALLRSAGTV